MNKKMNEEMVRNQDKLISAYLVSNLEGGGIEMRESEVEKIVLHCVQQ